MASVASERIPIATLHPSLPTPATKSITAIVTILWPYSSSTRTCALLLAEPDFRLRRRRGQVRVQFFGDAAYAVATSQLGIGDKVVVKLGGVQWLQSSGEEEVVRTPGKSVDWELGFSDRLAMLVTRDGKQFANIEVERSTPEPAEEESEEEAVYNTPSRIVGRFSAEGLRFNTWSSPAFLKHGRLSGESTLDYDLFADDDESKSRKRRRTSFKNVGVWTYAARTPSPEKGDTMSVDEDALASPSGQPSVPAPQALELPHTPVSAKLTPAEAVTDQEEDLVPDSARDNGELIDEPRTVIQAARKDLHEDSKDHDDTLYKQYLHEVHEDQEGDTEVDEYTDEPEEEPLAPFSVRDAQIIHGDSDAESLPSVIPDTEIAVPSAAASVRVDESTGDTEHSAEEDFGAVEVSSTEVDSELDDSEHLEVEGRRVSATLGLSSTEEDTSDQERESVASSDQYHEGRYRSLDTSHQASEAPADLLETDGNEREEIEEQAASAGSKEDKPAQEHKSKSLESQYLGSVLGATAATIMPPPVLPQPQADMLSSTTSAKTPPIGPINAPSTPQLQPVTSMTLPLPSPFPGTAEASSYMDVHAASPTGQPPTAVTDGHEPHEIRPATAMSVAQAAHEALRSSQLHPSNESALEPRPQMREQLTDVIPGDSQSNEPRPELNFGLDGAAQSAARESTSEGTRKTPDMVDLQDAQQYDSALVRPTEIVEEKQGHRDMRPTAQEVARHTHTTSGTNLPLIRPSENKDRILTSHATTVLEESAVQDLQEPAASISGPAEHYGSTLLREMEEILATESSREKKEESTKDQEIDISVLPSDDSYLPIVQDDDWDMPDAEAGAEGTSTPRAPPSTKDGSQEGDVTPTATLQKRTPAVSSSARQLPVSSAADIVDLGSDSTEEESKQPIYVPKTVELTPAASIEGLSKDTASSRVSQLSQEVTQTIETQSVQETLRSSPPFSPPRTRRRTRQSTVETISQADTSTPRSQRRNLRSSQVSRASRASQETSGVAARVAQRRRRTEVKDSECEWDSNASISTQRPSSPSAPSIRYSFRAQEPSAGPEPSQILGELSQMEQRTREESSERPSISPITPPAPMAVSESPQPASRRSDQNRQEARDRRVEHEMAEQKTNDPAAERSSSPFPKLNFEWRPQRKPQPGAETQAEQERFSIVRGEPSHSSLLRDDSSILRAMRTSQFPFGTLPEMEATPSVEDSERAAGVDSQLPIVREEASSQPLAEAISDPKQFEQESQMQHQAASLRRVTEDTGALKPHKDNQHLSGIEPSRDQNSSLSVTTMSSAVDSAARVPKPFATDQRTAHESNVLTPEASQEVSPPHSAAPANHFDSSLPPTPRLTQATSATPSILQTDSQKNDQQTKQSVEVWEESEDEDFGMDGEQETVSAGAAGSQKSKMSRAIKWTPTQLSQGTRTSYSYFTPLAHLSSHTNSQTVLVDVLAVCTAPNKAPVRANTGPRDYSTLFSITDTSLENGTAVRVQVFRPWKAALPECDVGDSVLLRGFQVKSRKGRPCLVSGGESAWCVFRYGEIQKLKSSAAASQTASQDVTDAEGEDGAEKQGAKKRGHAKRKSDIMESVRPIWADVVSGLWGAVASHEEQQGASAKGDEAKEVEGDEAEAVEVHHNAVSGATREEVHGPPVEYGDEERREARDLREWWVGVGGREGSGKEVKPERRRGTRRTVQDKKVDAKDKEKQKIEEVKEEKTEGFSSKDFFRSFL